LAELKFFGYLADLVGTRTMTVQLEKPVPLREILPARFPKADVIILVNQKAGSMDSLIENDHSVLLMPVLSGG
jgi:molybdopterin converting factor small subunit